MLESAPEPVAETEVLIVEDEDSVRAAIEAGLDVIGGFKIISATGAEEGLRYLESNSPEILLLDLVMPMVDGMEFLSRLGSGSQYSRPSKVVLMTAMENPVPEGNLKDLGIDLVLSKPFRLTDLADAVGRESPF